MLKIKKILNCPPHEDSVEPPTKAVAPINKNSNSANQILAGNIFYRILVLHPTRKIFSTGIQYSNPVEKFGLIVP